MAKQNKKTPDPFGFWGFSLKKMVCVGLQPSTIIFSIFEAGSFVLDMLKMVPEAEHRTASLVGEKPPTYPLGKSWELPFPHPPRFESLNEKSHETFVSRL